MPKEYRLRSGLIALENGGGDTVHAQKPAWTIPVQNHLREYTWLVVCRRPMQSHDHTMIKEPNVYKIKEIFPTSIYFHYFCTEFAAWCA